MTSRSYGQVAGQRRHAPATRQTAWRKLPAASASLSPSLPFCPIPSLAGLIPALVPLTSRTPGIGEAVTEGLWSEIDELQLVRASQHVDAPSARDPELIKKLDAVAARVLHPS